jgi:hypothetical protein
MIKVCRAILAIILVGAAASLSAAADAAYGKRVRVGSGVVEAVLYRSRHDQYVVLSSSSPREDQLQRFSSRGVPVGPPVNVFRPIPAGDEHGERAVAYDASDDSYLMVARYDPGGELVAQSVSGDAGRLGQPAAVTPSGEAVEPTTQPTLTYDSRRHDFLATWTAVSKDPAFESGTACTVFAERLQPSGRPIGTRVQVLPTHDCPQLLYVVGFDDRADRFVVAWSTATTSYARRLDSTATHVGRAHAIGSTRKFGEVAAVAFNDRRRAFELLTTPGAKIGGSLRILALDASGRRRASTSVVRFSDQAAFADIAYVRRSDTLVLAWVDFIPGSDCPTIAHAQTFRGDAKAAIGRRYKSRATCTSRIGVAADPRRRSYMFAWSRSPGVFGAIEQL